MLSSQFSSQKTDDKTDKYFILNIKFSISSLLLNSFRDFYLICRASVFNFVFIVSM